jgi:peptidoglycan/LPS O-acetylase OafA/YrhL
MSERPILRPVMPELDSVRGIAILAVLLYHGLYWQVNLAAFSRWQRIFLSGFWLGRLGVSLFFVLSGFLITGLLIDSKSRLDYYRRFYVRRALRILPAYFALLGILAATRYASWPFILLSLAYLANFTRFFGVAIAYPVLWSLAVEEHFYLLWPWVVRKLSMRSLAACCLAIIALSPLLRLWSLHLAAH